MTGDFRAEARPEVGGNGRPRRRGVLRGALSERMQSSRNNLKKVVEAHGLRKLPADYEERKS